MLQSNSTPQEEQPSSLLPGVGPAKPQLRAGEKLLAARKRLGLSLDELAMRTRVRREFLEALEVMDMKLLPGRAYALAYLRSYANALGLDARAIAAQFERESALTREDPQPQLRNPDSKPRPHRPWLAALALGLALAGFIGWKVWSGQQLSPSPESALIAAAPSGARPGAIAAANPVQEHDIEVYALQSQWLEARGPDGTIFLSRVMVEGERYSPEVGAGWTLHAKDGGAFEVYVDGASIGPLGKESAPVLGRPVDSLVLRTIAKR